MTITIVWLDGSTEIVGCESAIAKDGVLSLYPMGYGACGRVAAT